MWVRVYLKCRNSRIKDTVILIQTDRDILNYIDFNSEIKNKKKMSLKNDIRNKESSNETEF